jgi:tight adherence protein B
MVAPGGGAWLLALLVSVSVALVTVALSLALEWVAAWQRRKGVAAQLARLATEGFESLTSGSGGLVRDTNVDAPWVRKLSARVPHLRDIKSMLEQADLPWTVQTYLMLACGLGAALGTGVLLATGRLAYTLPAAVIGGALPYLYVRHRRTRRLKRFEELFPGAVDLLGRAIRAGHPLASGMRMVVEECPEPVAGEFRRTFEEQRFGLPVDDSLVSLADRVPLVDVRIFVTALLIQREVGGNLAEILDNLSHIVRERFTLMRQVRVLTAEGRLSMYVLGAMPFGVGGFVLIANPEYIMTLFTHPIGRLMFGTALVLQAAGWLWMKKITDIEF